jgi:hypothetical protein
VTLSLRDNQILMEAQTGKQSDVALTQTNDYCGYTQNGVLNHWFYLTIGSQEQMTLEILIMLQE